MKIVIENELDEAIELVARLSGFEYRNRGNCAGVVRALALGTYRLMKSEDSIAGRKWMLLCDRLIAVKTTFILTYKNSDDRFESFIVLYGEIALHEHRYYLDALVLNSYHEVLSLNLNRSFRFDRIVDIKQSDASWHHIGLNFVIAKFQLFGQSSSTYERQSVDVEIEPASNGVLVSRRISNIYWFTRSMLGYGSDVLVITPDDARSNLKSIYAKALDRMC